MTVKMQVTNGQRCAGQEALGGRRGFPAMPWVQVGEGLGRRVPTVRYLMKWVEAGKLGQAEWERKGAGYGSRSPTQLSICLDTRARDAETSRCFGSLGPESFPDPASSH